MIINGIEVVQDSTGRTRFMNPDEERFAQRVFERVLTGGSPLALVHRAQEVAAEFALEFSASRVSLRVGTIRPTQEGSQLTGRVTVLVYEADVSMKVFEQVCN